jgi:3-oxoacyl-[acyl-carrier protein] reductase
MSDLKDRVALITGGSRGIGNAVALALARGGAAVAINYRERDNDANAVVDATRKSGGHAAAFGADVSLSAAVQDMVHDVQERLGPIDILVNNAGMAAVRGLDDITKEDFDRTIMINLKSVFLCTQVVLPRMRQTIAVNGGARVS